MRNSTVFKFLTYFFAIYPLFAIFSLKVLGNAPGNITGLMMVLLLLFFVFNVKTFKQSAYVLYFALFFIYITILNLIKVEDDETTIIKFLYTNKAFHFLIFLMLIQLDIKAMKININIIYYILSIIIILSAVVIIIQQFDPFFFIEQGYIKDVLTPEKGITLSFEDIRSSSIYSYTGQMGVGFIFIPFVAIVVNKHLIKKKTQLVYIFLFMGFLVAILTKSRWVMVNSLILFVMVAHYSHKGFTRWIRIAIGFTILFFLVSNLLPLLGINLNDLISNRILETSQGGLTKGSASTRLLAFEVFFKLFPHNPIFGVGMQLNNELLTALAGRSSQIHVGYLSLFYHYGLIGGFLYLGFNYYLTRSLYRNAQFHGYYAPLYAWIGFMLANWTLFYLMPFEAGILLVLLMDKYYLITQRIKLKRILLKPNPNIKQ